MHVKRWTPSKHEQGQYGFDMHVGCLWLGKTPSCHGAAKEKKEQKNKTLLLGARLCELLFLFHM